MNVKSGTRRRHEDEQVATNRKNPEEGLMDSKSVF